MLYLTIIEFIKLFLEKYEGSVLFDGSKLKF